MERRAQSNDLCTRCKTRPRKTGQRVCRECHAEYMKEWRAARAHRLTRVQATDLLVGVAVGGVEVDAAIERLIASGLRLRRSEEE